VKEAEGRETADSQAEVQLASAPLPEHAPVTTAARQHDDAVGSSATAWS
jgi:hypothetical protein